ncbi:hypothetical protein [Methylobacterium sp.]|uniref:hypothetical protein n=1 Tax=Methylobacterium sp. TaxID=409 RepID=UPI003AFFAC81
MDTSEAISMALNENKVAHRILPIVRVVSSNPANVKGCPRDIGVDSITVLMRRRANFDLDLEQIQRSYGVIASLDPEHDVFISVS